MLLSKKVLDRIKKVVEGRYASLLLDLVGLDFFSEEEKADFRKKGIKLENKDDILKLIYDYNYLNNNTTQKPKNLAEARVQSDAKRKISTRQTNTLKNQKMAVTGLVEQLKSTYLADVSLFLSQANNQYESLSLDKGKEIAKNFSLNQFKQHLKDSAAKSNRSWTTTAVTEMSNIVALASLDSITEQNEDKDPSEIYVYKVIADSKACPWCKKFYGETTPKLYKLSDLTANGTNMGKAKKDWKPVVGVTHPNTRTSPIIELKPNFGLTAKGTQEWIGPEKWKEFLKKNLV